MAAEADRTMGGEAPPPRAPTPRVIKTHLPSLAALLGEIDMPSELRDRFYKATADDIASLLRHHRTYSNNAMQIIGLMIWSNCP